MDHFHRNEERPLFPSQPTTPPKPQLNNREILANINKRAKRAARQNEISGRWPDYDPPEAAGRALAPPLTHPLPTPNPTRQAGGAVRTAGRARMGRLLSWG